MTQPPDTTPRRRRPLVIGAVLLGVLAIAAVAVLFGVNREQDASPAPATPVTTVPFTPGSTESPSTSGSAPAAAQLADGCLGGPDPFAAILPAQQAATQDISGAAAFARTFGRWSVTYPIDPAAPQVVDAIVFPGSNYGPAVLDGLNQLARNLQAQGYTESRTIPNQGAYRISTTSDPARVSLDLILHRQLTRSDGRVEEMKMAITIILKRSNQGPWYISGTLPPMAADPFADVEASPWLPYKGAC